MFACRRNILGIIFPAGIFQFVLKIFQSWNNIPSSTLRLGISIFQLFQLAKMHNRDEIMHVHAQKDAYFEREILPLCMSERGMSCIMRIKCTRLAHNMHVAGWLLSDRVRHAASQAMNNFKKLFTRTLELFIILSVEKRRYSSASVGWMNNRGKMREGDE